MDDMEFNSGYVVGGAGILLAIGQMAWHKFFSSEGKANDALIEQLSQRLAGLDARQVKLEADLDDERKRRREAEDKVHALEMANVVLRSELAKYGIKIDPALLPNNGLPLPVETEGAPT